MIDTKLSRYRQPGDLPAVNGLWPLYGTGFDNLGPQLLAEPLPRFGPDELLVRHDAAGLCFTDVKIINNGPQHYRVERDMQKEPLVLGHEVTMTVVGVGEHLAGQYRVGERFIVQPALYAGGIFSPYGVAIRGGLCQYGVVDQRVLNSDDGNHLVAVRPETGYAESALVEPWSCVLTAYQLNYRTGLKPGGTTWIIGTGAGDKGYFISAGFDERSHPRLLALTQAPPGLDGRLRREADRLQVEIIDISLSRLYDPTTELPGFDDIIVLGPAPDLIEAASRHLNQSGILAIIAAAPLDRPVQVDVGGLHYEGWTYVGGPGPDIARAYADHPVRSELKPGGKTWFLGAGGPMGQMHTARAVGLGRPPAAVLCTARTPVRLRQIEAAFAPAALAKEIKLVCLSLDQENYAARLADLAGTGFDNIIVLALAPAAIAEAAAYLAPGGVMNIYAGLKRGTLVPLDLTAVVQRNVRFVGQLGTTVRQLKQTLDQIEAGQLSARSSVQAIGSLAAARTGLEAVRDARFPGKVVIFPQIKDIPLTPLGDLKQTLPGVYARLRDGREWTVAAEQEFLELMLP